MTSENGNFDLVEKPAPSEASLQAVLLVNPQLLPAEDLGLDGDLLVVGRETTLASGRIDLLCLSRSGELVIVEFKTGPRNPDFRHALAQVIDYGADLWRLGTVQDLDEGLVRGYLAGLHVANQYKNCDSLEALAKESLVSGRPAMGRLRRPFTYSSREGRFRLCCGGSALHSSYERHGRLSQHHG